MNLDIYSDPICPWCYIGKRRLDRALARLSWNRRPQIAWRAFMLNPDMPPRGMERNAYLARKFGSARQVHTIYDAIARSGLEEGIPFAFGAISRTPSTVLAHRLIARSMASGRQESVVDALFRAYFLGGRDIGDAGTLADIAEGAGLDRAQVMSWLDGGGGPDPVLRDHERATELGIRSVPCFVFDGRYALAGAHSPGVLLRLMGTVRDIGDA